MQTNRSIVSTMTTVAVLLLWVGIQVPDVHGQAAVARKPAQEALEALRNFLGRGGAGELGDELAKLGGETTVRRIAERAVREGGDDALDLLVRVTRAHGPDALRAADNVVNIPAVLRAVDELPTEMAVPALRRLAAGAEGRVLADTVSRMGSRALRAEVRHPGVGGHLARHLGDDGVEIALRSSPSQAIMVARHADDIARLPETQKAGILRILREDFERFAKFMGEFVAANPGKTLFTVGATPIIIANRDRLFGGEGEMGVDENGNPVFVPKTGMVERVVERTIASPLRRGLEQFINLAVIAASIWLAIKLLFYYRKCRGQHLKAQSNDR